MTADIDWSRWSIVLLKPDAVERKLTGPILAMLQEHVAMSAITPRFATEEQILDHYADILAPDAIASIGLDVRAELLRLYLGKPIVIALAQGTDAPHRLRALIGPTDPEACTADTVRGRWAADSLALARREQRLINNLIHTSDTDDAVPHDFDCWYGHHQRTHLLIPSPAA